VAVFSSTGQLLGAALTGAIAASRSVTAGAAAGYSLAFFITGLLSLLLFGITFLLKNRASEQATVQRNEKAPATD
jgi:predicted phage tail protein